MARYAAPQTGQVFVTCPLCGVELIRVPYRVLIEVTTEGAFDEVSVTGGIHIDRSIFDKHLQEKHS